MGLGAVSDVTPASEGKSNFHRVKFAPGNWRSDSVAATFGLFLYIAHFHIPIRLYTISLPLRQRGDAACRPRIASNGGSGFTPGHAPRIPNSNAELNRRGAPRPRRFARSLKDRASIDITRVFDQITNHTDADRQRLLRVRNKYQKTSKQTGPLTNFHSLCLWFALNERAVAFVSRI
jgi:hypothetical protein